MVFDKTGTLTLEAPVLQNPEAIEALDGTARSALLALVRDNPHPISQCLLEHLLSLGAVEPLEGDVREVVGCGVELGPWSLGRPQWRSRESRQPFGLVPPARPAGQPTDDEIAPGTDAEFAWAGVTLACFRFVDTARPGANAEIEALARRGLQTFILSGDREAKVTQLARELGLPLERAIGARSPQEKAAWIEQHAPVDALMLGDGANDSLAFDRALCRGTPVVHRGVLEQKADFYYLGRGIGGLRALFEIDVIRRRTQLAILIFSIAYNLLAVGLAVAGRMNPLVAAALMPINSLLTLAIVVGGMRRTLSWGESPVR
jgi:Cu2+-exporting ATPase